MPERNTGVFILENAQAVFEPIPSLEKTTERNGLKFGMDGDFGHLFGTTEGFFLISPQGPRWGVLLGKSKGSRKCQKIPLTRLLGQNSKNASVVPNKCPK